MNHLQKKTLSLGISKDEVSKLELDHIEASKPDQNNLEKYFIDDERDFYIHGLGNIMPLPKKENIEKSNKPMKESFDFYEKSGLGPGHHLYDNAVKLFQKNNSQNIPSKEFFIERKEQIKKMFMLAVDLN